MTTNLLPTDLWATYLEWVAKKNRAIKRTNDGLRLANDKYNAERRKKATRWDKEQEHKQKVARKAYDKAVKEWKNTPWYRFRGDYPRPTLSVLVDSYIYYNPYRFSRSFPLYKPEYKPSCEEFLTMVTQNKLRLPTRPNQTRLNHHE